MGLLGKNIALEFAVSPFPVELFQNIREFGKNILQTIELLIRFSHLLLQIELFLTYFFFLKKSQRRGTLHRLLDKCSHLFICISLKQTLRSDRKPVSTCQNPDIRTNSPCCYILLKRVEMASSNNV